MKMSVGNMYNYFVSKEDLARYAISFSTKILASKIKEINKKNITVREKIELFVEMHLSEIRNRPEIIEYFLRVYLSNKEIFKSGYEGFLLINDYVTEVMILLEDGAKKGELRNQSFFAAFGILIGALGGFAFLNGENVLENDVLSYSDEVSENIYRALKA